MSDAPGNPAVTPAIQHIYLRATDIASAEEADATIAALQQARRSVFGEPEPRASVVEIVQQRDKYVSDVGSGSLIMPRHIRINGTPVYTTGGVRVHEINLTPSKDMAQVTLTLPVRLLLIGVEGDLGD